MREPQAGIKLAIAPSPELSQQLATPKRQLPSLPIMPARRQQVTNGLRRLESQANRINQLSAELEEEMIELKTIASQVNRDLKSIQTTQKTFPDVCEYGTVIVPHVGQKPSGSLILATRSVDLFKAEREAALVAQQLRQRAKRKRVNRHR